ncbi:PREDICTED: uncharacterized protein LOC109191492 [Ipomoea nil]|uniref:uncharacterized protein LOC109191492 n=1 Tax=Ipomoea nil TaxID=35883 RepID=UPI0009018AFB|nr:PREDICTED: uncharacterized protein LOC109191492 [Ipomoea nil]
MTELHSGLCSSHQWGRSLVCRIMVISYYWPSIQLDCEKLAKECEACQLFAKMPGRPATFYQPFGVPVQLIMDNGKQFEGQYFQNFLATIRTKSLRSTVAYPQGNGQVENANRTILDGLKKKLYMFGRSWADELPFILWTYRTTPREATRETLFALVYGVEARLPIEAWIPTALEKNYDPEGNESLLAIWIA